MLKPPGGDSESVGSGVWRFSVFVVRHDIQTREQTKAWSTVIIIMYNVLQRANKSSFDDQHGVLIIQRMMILERWQTRGLNNS